MYQSVSATTVECGLLYSMAIFVYVLTSILAAESSDEKKLAVEVIQCTILHITGISPTLIAVRIGLGKEFEDNLANPDADRMQTANA
ncbi:hypothetical protein E1B28_006590 [Marasmius oreades]|uniref:Uncharacterized protein n=1 Tax=Marasmius oreades TaxID=181124 RepID=A0A9P7UWG1_9AGAR|nr:uncharacterized protein E1B28_006590 [Marasmius oreades]KAG7095903.1 hypothetical protein E1B28_006590 [Marasmius oreades]